MTPEAAAFLGKARRSLEKASGMLDRWPDEAGRLAYLAGFQAAQALIFERREQVAKTHRGVQALFAELAVAEPGLDPALRSFLSRSYAFKTAADYETTPTMALTPERIRTALGEAERLVTAVAGALARAD